MDCEKRTDILRARAVEIESTPHGAPEMVGQFPIAAVVRQQAFHGQPVEPELAGARQPGRRSRVTVPHPHDLPAGAAHRPTRIAAQEFRFQVQVRRIVFRIDAGKQVLQRPYQAALADRVGAGDDVDAIGCRLEVEPRFDSRQGVYFETVQMHQSCSGACSSNLSRAR